MQIVFCLECGAKRLRRRGNVCPTRRREVPSMPPTRQAAQGSQVPIHHEVPAHTDHSPGNHEWTQELSMDIRTVAFVGLGVMGEAMCRNLARKGSWKVVGYDTRQEPMQRLEADGVTSATSLADAVAEAEVVLMCLPGGVEVEAVARGPGGLLSLVRGGQTVADMSTAPPRLMRELAKAFQAKGVEFADAPVARTRRAAVDGTLSVMVGASEAVFDRLRPILATMGTEITLCGGVGAGQVVKVMNNMVVFETTMAIAEAICIAEAAGVDGRL